MHMHAYALIVKYSPQRPYVESNLIFIQTFKYCPILSKTFTYITCIVKLSLTYSAFQFRLAATGSEKRLRDF